MALVGKLVKALDAALILTTSNDTERCYAINLIATIRSTVKAAKLISWNYFRSTKSLCCMRHIQRRFHKNPNKLHYFFGQRNKHRVPIWVIGEASKSERNALEDMIIFIVRRNACIKIIRQGEEIFYYAHLYNNRGEMNCLLRYSSEDIDKW